MESNVRIAPDSTGKRVRTVEVTTSQGVVEQQVVVVANERGDLAPTDEVLTAFGAQRVSHPITLFDSKLLYDKQSLFWDEATVGGGTSTHVPSAAHVELAVTSASDSAVRQSRQRFNYQSGKGQLVMATGLWSKQSGVRKRVGYFDGTDGVFLEVTGTAVSVNVMKGGAVLESVAQASWNLDRFDGTGPSGVTLDLTATQILAVDFQWLGSGRVRVGFIVGGRLIYAHAIYHSNVSGNVSVYMGTPNLPVRYEILSTAGSGTMTQICSTVISEGGSEERGLVFSADTGVTPLALPSTGKVAMVAVRLKSDHLSASILPLGVDVLLTTAGNARWELRMTPAVAGPALSYAGVDNTSVEVARGAATNLATGGFLIDSGWVSTQSRQVRSHDVVLPRLGVGLAGDRDVMVLAVENVTQTPSALAQIGFRELL